MPLYMDFHQFDHVTIEDVKMAHIADIAVQDRYGVKYHQFWVNEEAGTVFCLMEGPDKESCTQVHRLAHGNVACAITEVESGFYKLAMGFSIRSQSGLVKHSNGTVDSGCRSILVISVRGIIRANNSKELHYLLIPLWAKRACMSHLKRYGGRKIAGKSDDSIVALFDDSDEAIRCTRSINKELVQGNLEHHPRVIFKMGLSTGQPVTEDGDFFNRLIKLSHQFCDSAGDNQVLVAPMIRKNCNNPALLDAPFIKWLTPAEELFLTDLLNTLEVNLSNEKYTIHKLCRNIGISRPQLYRKVISITGKSPNAFIRDFRMQKAFSLIKEKKFNVSEVALQVGFNNPSYFTKCFHEKFGHLPSKSRV